MDFPNVKSITIPDGVVAKIEVGGSLLWELPVSYTNKVLTSIDANGNIYNGRGYKISVRLSSTGEEKALTAGITTGFIPLKKGDVLRIKPTYEDATPINYLSLNFYGSDFGWLGQQTMQPLSYGICKNADYNTMVMVGDTEVFELNQSNADSVSYVRITHSMSKTGSSNEEIKANFIVTINEEIT